MAIKDFKVRNGIVVGPDDFSVDVSTDTASFADGYVVNIGTDRVLKQTDNISELTNDSGYLVSKADVDALGVDAGTLDSITSTQFLRSDQDGTVSGNLTVSGGTGPAVFSVIADSDNINENDTATIVLSQDGGLVTGAWGFDSNNVMYFESLVGTGAATIDFRTNNGGTARVNDNLIFHAGNSRPYSTTEQNKLSNIEDNATRDQTKFDIDALNIDADTLDGVNSSQFLRSDVSNLYTGVSLTLVNEIAWQVSSANTALQRADARIDGTDEARLHCYGRNTGASSTRFRQAWYDGSSYVNVDVISGVVTVDGGIKAEVYEGDKIKTLSTDYQNAARNEGVTVEYNESSKSLDYNFF